MSGFASGAANFLASAHKVRVIGPNPTTSRGQSLVVNAHPKEARIIYPSGKMVVVKSLTDPADCFVYRGHSATTTVAKFSPNGFWVASADTSGKVRVWSWDNPEHLLKLECPALGGPVLDLDWDSENRRIVVCGESGGMMVKAFTWDTGNSLGEMVGHNKRVTSVSYRGVRPFRVLTGSEDFKTVAYAGPPFKLEHSNQLHTNFVNAVRYSPDGARAVSVGSDKRIQFYDGATLQPTTDIPNGHAGTISSVAWSPDSSKLLTASADKTAKVWDAATGTCETTFTFADFGTAEGSQVGDMQVSALWTASGHMITVSLNGNINVLNAATPSEHQTIQAHQTPVTAVVVDAATGRTFTGSSEGVVFVRDGLLPTCTDAISSTRAKGSDKRQISGNAHTNKVVSLAVLNATTLASVGWDDSLRLANITAEGVTYTTCTSLNGQPSAMANDGELMVVATNQELSVFVLGEKVATLGQLGYGALSVSVRPGGGQVAVGGDDNKTHIYSIDGANHSLTHVHAIETRSAVTAVAYHPTGDMLAVGDAGRQVEVHDSSAGGAWATVIKGKWVFHTSKVTCLAWSPSGTHLASGSLDESIYVWCLATPMKKLHIPFAHSGGVAGLQWMRAAGGSAAAGAEDEDKFLVSVGNDQTVVTWDRTKQ